MVDLQNEQLVSMQNSENFKSLMRYKSAMAQARLMLCKGLITEKEYAIIETKMCEMFGINFDSLFRDNDLIHGEL